MTEFNSSANEPSNEQPLHQHVGFEILAEEERIKVSRFSRRIRLLHWFNAIAIIGLYSLAMHSLVSSNIMFDFYLADLRSWHITLGISWIIGIPILWLTTRFRVHRNRSSITSDQLIIKQRLFLFTSVGLMIFMAFSGSLLALLRPYDIPQLRSIILLLHGLVAFSYLPLLATHIYLAILQRDSRQSLRTMISDVQIKYLIHNHIPKLHCGLSDEEGILFIKGKVSEINLRGFHAHIEQGSWQKSISLNQLVHVAFQHPELTDELILPVSIYSDYVKDGCLHVNFNFNLPLQEASHQLLSRGVFFRALFLARRHSPRLNCNYPIEITYAEQHYVAQAIDIGLGGMGIIVPLRLPKGSLINIHLELKNPVVNWYVTGLIVVKSHIRNNDYSYGLCFKNLNKSEIQQLSTVLLNIKNQQSNKNTHYWTSE